MRTADIVRWPGILAGYAQRQLNVLDQAGGRRFDDDAQPPVVAHVVEILELAGRT